ncbi:kinase-like domain-containing protein, partial [Morchella snyderi]
QYDHLFVKILSWYLDPSSVFMCLAMEYIKDGELSTYLDRHVVSIENAKIISNQILDGLDFIHSMKIYHRDIKPQNILVACKDPIWIKIANFGISKQVMGTTTHAVCGTRLCCAPE